MRGPEGGLPSRGLGHARAAAAEASSSISSLGATAAAASGVAAALDPRERVVQVRNVAVPRAQLIQLHLDGAHVRHFSSSSRVASCSPAPPPRRAPGEAWWWLRVSSSRDPPRGAPSAFRPAMSHSSGGAHPRSRAWTTTARARPNARCRASRRLPRTRRRRGVRVERREMTSREGGTARPRHGCPEGHGSRGHRHRVVPEDPRVREGGSPSSLQRGAPEAGPRAARSSEEKADKSTMRSYSRRRRVFRPPTADATNRPPPRSRARAPLHSPHTSTLHTYRVTTSTSGRPSMKHETCHVEDSFPFRAARASARRRPRAPPRENVPIDAPPIVSDTQCLFPDALRTP